MRRNQAVECLRIVSAFGIVWFHSGLEGNTVAYSGLFVFLTLSSYFVTIAGPKDSKIVAARASRLLLPWTFWFLFYAVENVIRGHSIFPITYNYISDVFAGPQIHLWYLPFAFMSLTAIEIAKRWLRVNILVFVAASGAGLMLLTSPLWEFWSCSPPLPQYMNAIVPTLTGVLLGMRGKTHVAGPLFLAISLLSLAIVLTSVSGAGEPCFVGLAATALAVDYGGRIVPKTLDVRWLSSCMFGVYLTHPVFLSLAKMVCGVEHPSGVVAAFVLSSASVWLFLRHASPAIAKVVFGRERTQPPGASAHGGLA